MAAEAERVLGDRLHTALAVCTSTPIRLPRGRLLIAGHGLGSASQISRMRASDAPKASIRRGAR